MAGLPPTCCETCSQMTGHGPLPYQFKDSPRSEAPASPRPAVEARPMGWLCAAVAVTSALSDLCYPQAWARRPRLFIDCFGLGSGSTSVRQRGPLSAALVA